GSASFTDDTITIKGSANLRGGTIDSYNDHRIVMASAVAGLKTENAVTINDAHAVNKSYTDFFNDYLSLGGKANVIMG
ncbi:MAG: 3-phosphoshikimate 1-carboxyvinyltransferase, partial [Eubacteriales bacterium]|nr:3-phosphoshikimate 1-carboxyvinyltransferase [Eubacteriales bacterium]